MAVYVDYQCANCTEFFEMSKMTVQADFPIDVPCPKCKDGIGNRFYGKMTFHVPTGKLGNARNGYQSGFVDHKSSLIPKKVKAETGWDSKSGRIGR